MRCYCELGIACFAQPQVGSKGDSPKGTHEVYLVFKPFSQAEKKVAELMTLDHILDRLDNGDETLKKRLGSALLDHLLQSITQAQRRGHGVARRPAVGACLFLGVEDTSSSPFSYMLLYIQQDEDGAGDSAGWKWSI